MKVEYGISFISILNFFKSISQVVDNFSRIGYSVFQSLPLRKVSGEEENIVCFEDVWRPELNNIFQIQKGRVFDDLLSFYLFKQGSRREKILKLYKWRKIQQIRHTWDDMDDYVEISNQMSSKNLKYIEKITAAMNTHLVPDIKHLKEFMQEHNVTIEEIVSKLGYMFAPIIHFQPLCSVKDFIEKKDIDSSEEIHIFNAVLYAILENFHDGMYKTDKITIIVEYNPAFLIFSEKKSLETAKKMLEIIRKYL